jgi:hypothetical protein
LSGHEGLKQGKEEGEYCHPMTPEGLFTVALGLGEGCSVNQRSDIRWCKIFPLPFSLQEVFTERKEKPKPLAIP